MLWVDMRRMTSTFSESGFKPLKFDKELLDIVWNNFVTGGCFSRALEVISMMEQWKILIDKFKYNYMHFINQRII